MNVAFSQEHDRHIQFLMQQISPEQSAESAENLAAKVRTLEKDLYYYRKTSRDLRKKLQTPELERGGGGNVGGPPGIEGAKRAEEHVNSAPELDGSGMGQGVGLEGSESRQKKKKRKGQGRSSVVGLVAQDKMAAGEMNAAPRMEVTGPAERSQDTSRSVAGDALAPVVGIKAAPSVSSSAQRTEPEVTAPVSPSVEGRGGAIEDGPAEGKVVVRKHIKELRQLR